MRKDKVVSEILGEEAALSPSDVCEMRFKRVLRGYDTTEVDRYLERVADILEGLIEQVRSLKDTVQEQKARIEEFRQMESTWRDALVSSQKFAEDTLAVARREAHALLEEARMKRAKEALEAHRIPEVLSRDIQTLEQQRARLRVEMLSILDTHRHLLDSHIPEQPSYLPSSDTNINYLTHNPEPDEMSSADGEDSESAEHPRTRVWLGEGLPDVDDADAGRSDDFAADDSKADVAAAESSPEESTDGVVASDEQEPTGEDEYSDLQSPDAAMGASELDETTRVDDVKTEKRK